MNIKQNIEREAGSGIDVALEKIAKVILDAESFERTSVAACEIEKRDVQEYKTETNEISRKRNETTADENLVFDGESGWKERNRKTMDQI